MMVGSYSEGFVISKEWIKLIVEVDTGSEAVSSFQWQERQWMKKALEDDGWRGTNDKGSQKQAMETNRVTISSLESE